jgi:hypothetical protein
MEVCGGETHKPINNAALLITDVESFIVKA